MKLRQNKINFSSPCPLYKGEREINKTGNVNLSNFANGFYLVKAYNLVYGNKVKQLIIVK